MRALFDPPFAQDPPEADLVAAVPPIDAVLFDFSNTLFHMIGTDEWLRRIAADTGRALDRAARHDVVRELDAAARRPDVVDAQRGRDLGPVAHRRAMDAWFGRVGFLAADLDAAYARVVADDSWVPYPDTGPTLRALVAGGLAVGVVSDIAWDIRRHAARSGLDGLVGSWMISGEQGIEKPDPRLFARACHELGADPRRTLMVGDSPTRDSGASVLGCRALVLAGEHRLGERGLADVLTLARVAG